MRMLFFVGGSSVYGMERVYLTLLPALQRLGHEVHALVGGWNDGIFPKLLEGHEVPFTELKLGRLYITKPRWTLTGLASFPAAVRQLVKLRNGFNPEVVVMVEAQSMEVAGRIFRGAIQIFHVHNSLDKALYRLPYSWSMRKITRYISVSAFVDNQLQHIGIAPEKRNVVLNGAEDTAMSMRSRIPVHRDLTAAKIAIVGRVSPSKQSHVILEAAALLKEWGVKGFSINFFGEAEPAYRAAMVRHSQERGIVDIIKFHGFRSDIAEIYGCSDMLVAPSVVDTAGMTLVEASAWALPIIAADAGGHPEMIVSDRTGLLFPPGDAGALAHSIATLIQNPKRTSMIGSAARERYEELFTPMSFANRFVDAIPLRTSVST